MRSTVGPGAPTGGSPPGSTVLILAPGPDELALSTHPSMPGRSWRHHCPERLPRTARSTIHRIMATPGATISHDVRVSRDIHDNAMVSGRSHRLSVYGSRGNTSPGTSQKPFSAPLAIGRRTGVRGRRGQ